MTPHAALLTALLLAGAAPPSHPDWMHRDLLAADAATLKAAGVANTDDTLLDYVRKRTLTAKAREKAQKLIADLADEEFAVRQQASAGLAEMGPVIVPILRPFADSADAEQRRRVRKLLANLEPKFDPGHMPAAARLLAVRRPAGAAAALLAYLPDAITDGEVAQLTEALSYIACPSDVPGNDVVAALSDREPRRRAAAGFAVGRCGSADHADAVRKLLADKDADVRAGTALGAAIGGDRDAVAVLVGLMGELPAARRGTVEDALCRLAGEAAPATPGEDGEAASKKRKEMWAAWWQKNQATADLRKLRHQATLGYTLCVLFEGSVRVSELGRDNKPLWEIKGLSNAVDAHIVPGNRVLIAEYGAGRVTERTFDGKIVWEANFTSGRSVNDNPFLAQRMPNGNVFAATRSGLIEVDRDGKEVWAKKDVRDIRAAWKYPDGRVAIVTGDNKYRRFDASGKEVKTYQTALAIGNSIGGIDFLPNGGLLAVTRNGVIEYDPDGKKVWEATGLRSPYCPTRLANGNTIVACTGTSQFLEYDRGGNVVRKIPTPGVTPWRARRR